jgi:hypothetical protein
MTLRDFELALRKQVETYSSEQKVLFTLNTRVKNRRGTEE